MSNVTDELKIELKNGLASLRTLRDEVRLKLHLASMDVRQQWKNLEPRLADVEKAADDVSHASRAALTEAIDALKRLRASLH